MTAAKAKPRFQQRYEKDLKPALKKKYGYTSDMQVPRLEKIVLNICVKEAAQNRGILDQVVEDMSRIAGQKAVKTTVRKANASFKIREGMAIGARVTLRGVRMYEFLDRLTTIAMPRIRDFRGINGKSFDGRGNYALGIKEYIVFPEISYDKVDKVRGMDIIICTSAKTDDEARELLRGFDMPFRSN